MTTSLRLLLETIAVVLSWFVLGVAMSSSTKWIFQYGDICYEGLLSKECHTFKFPLTITTIHMVFSWGMCWVQLRCFGTRPNGSAPLTIRQQLEKVAPLSICFSMSVAMGNMALKYIYPSFNLMLGSMAPLITFVMAVVWDRKSYNTWTWISMPILCGGLSVCSYKEANFNMLGAFFSFGATVLRAVKTIMQGRLLKDDKIDSVSLLFYMSPWAAAFLLVCALAVEGAEPATLLFHGLSGVGPWGLDGQPVVHISGGAMVLVLLVVSGLNACLMNVANFLVTAYTSPVTLQVLGNVRNCLSIIVSVVIFRNSMGIEQALGLTTCLFGVWLYNNKGGPARAPDKVPDKKPAKSPAVMPEEPDYEARGQPDKEGSAGPTARPAAAAIGAASPDNPQQPPVLA